MTMTSNETAVFRFFEQSSEDIAQKALSSMLDSKQFSYPINKRVKTILSRLNDELQGYWRGITSYSCQNRCSKKNQIDRLTISHLALSLM